MKKIPKVTKTSTRYLTSRKNRLPADSNKLSAAASRNIHDKDRQEQESARHRAHAQDGEDGQHRRTNKEVKELRKHRCEGERPPVGVYIFVTRLLLEIKLMEDCFTAPAKKAHGIDFDGYQREAVKSILSIRRASPSRPSRSRLRPTIIAGMRIAHRIPMSRLLVSDLDLALDEGHEEIAVQLEVAPPIGLASGPL